MLLNRTASTVLLRPKSSFIPHFFSLPTCNPSASTSRSTPLIYPKSIHSGTVGPISYLSQELLLTGPLTSAFVNHTHPALAHGLFTEHPVTLSTKNQITFLPYLKLSNIYSSHWGYSSPSPWPTEHSVLWPCPSGHILLLFHFGSISAVLALLLFLKYLCCKSIPFS